MNIDRKTGWTEAMKRDPISTMRREIVQVLGQLEADKRILFSTVEKVHSQLVREAKICPFGGCGGSMGCACPC